MHDLASMPSLGMEEAEYHTGYESFQSGTAATALQSEQTGAVRFSSVRLFHFFQSSFLVQLSNRSIFILMLQLCGLTQQFLIFHLI